MKLKHLTESYNRISQVYDMVEQSGTVTEEVEAAEDAYIGGVADLGDPEAVNWLVFRDNYEPYQKALQSAIQKVLGNTFIAYRIMHEEEYEEWLSGADIGFKSISTEQRVVEGLAKFHIYKDADTVVIKLRVPADSVLMRGHESEAELIIDTSQIEPNRDTEVLKRL